MSLQKAFQKETAKNKAIAKKTAIAPAKTDYAKRLAVLEINPKAMSYTEKRRLLNTFPYNVLANELEMEFVLSWFEIVSAFLGAMVTKEEATYEEIEGFVIDTQSKSDVRVWTNFDDLDHIKDFFYHWKKSQEKETIEEEEN